MKTKTGLIARLLYRELVRDKIYISVFINKKRGIDEVSFWIWCASWSYKRG